MNGGWNLLAVALGGSIGALARYALGIAGQRVSEDSVPWGIIASNLIGCFLIGLFYSLGQKDLPPAVKLGITVGFLGALTTFSTLCLDAVVLYQKHPVLAGGYVLGSFVAGIALVVLGQYVARLF